MAEFTTTPRLMAAAKEFNIGKDALVDFLVGKGFNRNELKPTAKLTEDMYRALQKEFQSDKVARLKALQIDLPKGGEAKKNREEVLHSPKKEKDEHDGIQLTDLPRTSDSAGITKTFDENVSKELEGPKILGKLELPVENNDRSKQNLHEKRTRKRIPIERRDVRPTTFTNRRITWQELKTRYRVGAELELTVIKKAAPGLLFFYITDKFLGVLHVSELNWNFGISQLDYKSIAVGSKLKVKVVGFEDRANQVHLSRKSLPSIQRPSTSNHWKNLNLKEEIQATIFEVFRNKVWVQLNTGLFATFPLVDGKLFRAGDKLHTPIKLTTLRRSKLTTPFAGGVFTPITGATNLSRHLLAVR